MLLLADKLRSGDRIDGQRRHAHVAAGCRALLLDVGRRVKQLGFYAKPVQRLRKKSPGFRTNDSRIGQAAVAETDAVERPRALRVEFPTERVAAKSGKIAFCGPHNDLFGVRAERRGWCLRIRRGAFGRLRFVLCSKLTKGQRVA